MLYFGSGPHTTQEEFFWRVKIRKTTVRPNISTTEIGIV